MTEDPSGTSVATSPPSPPSPPSPRTPPDTPLGRYNARLRRQRAVYFGAIAAVVVLLVVVVVVAWSKGETNNTTLRTAAAAPAALPLAPPAATQTEAWRTSATAAIGTPQWGGTVVVSDRHTVRGIDARTGRTTWSYTRSNRTVCTAAQLAGTTVAVYSVGGNCDQVTGLDSGTGQRRWTRTLDMDGMPVNGVPAFTTAAQGTYTTLLVRTRSVLYALDPASGNNRWTYTRYGCDITGAALGTAGALISQSCSSDVRCDSGQKFCASGVQLLLRDAYAGREDDNKTNPDKITWNLFGVRATPVSAGALVSAVAPDGRLAHYDPRTGAVTASTTLTARPTTASPTDAVELGQGELVWIAGRLYSIDPGTATPRWSTATGRPTVAGPDANSTPTPTNARVTTADSRGAVAIDAVSGARAVTSPIADLPAGSIVYPLGSGFLVCADGTTVAYA